MELIIKIAWRNILRHKRKSLVIGIILFVGVLMMTVGNSVISGMDRGLEKNIVNGFLGDIVIVSEKEKSDNILLRMYGESIEEINNYKEIKKVLEKEGYIEKFLPIGKNAAMVFNEDEGEPGYAYLIGVDFDDYKKMFPNNFTVLEGKNFSDSEPGMLLPVKSRSDLYDTMNIWFLPEGGKLAEENLTDDAKKEKEDLSLKNSLVLLGLGGGMSSSDIKLGIKGVIKYNALNSLWGHFSIIDIESYRNCLGYFSALESNTKITKQEEKLLSLDTENLDDMFGSESLVVANSGSSDFSSVNFKRKEAPKVENIDLEDGTYNLVLVKLKNSNAVNGDLSKLNKSLSDAKLGVKAIHWKKAAGPIGSMATIIKSFLFFVVMMLFFVAIIIIVNTLTMAALERTPEIGMMRAVGAHKGFISWMFFGETAMLSGVFGGLGIVVGIIIVKIIPLLHITSTNDMIQLIYGGDKFQPYLSMGDISMVIIQLLIVTLLTVIYPIKVAKGIMPLDAIARD